MQLKNYSSSPLVSGCVVILAFFTDSINVFAGLKAGMLCSGISIATPIIVIGTVTFALSFIGASVGYKLGRFFENKIEIAGGLVLVGIGVRILLEHLI